MARQAGKKQAPAKIEEDDDNDEGWEDGVVETDEKESAQNLRLRDWRDVERFRELKELRRLVDDDYGLEEIFHIPLKPRAEPGIPAPHTPARPARAGAPAKPAKAVAAPAKAQPPARPARPAKPVKKPAPSGARARHQEPATRPAKPRSDKLKAKAKRR